jgi:hypothetical protein
LKIAKLAKKYLAVPVSSAAVERICSFSGHILMNKRRKTSPYLFSNLVFLKLNEEFFLTVKVSIFKRDLDRYRYCDQLLI